MRKLFLALLLAVVASGCAMRTSGGMVFFPQRGIVLQMVHLCTDRAMVYQAGVGTVGEVIGATPKDFPLVPLPLMGGSRQISVTVQSFDTAGLVVGSYTQEFYTGQNTSVMTWVIGGAGWGGGGRRTPCQ